MTNPLNIRRSVVMSLEIDSPAHHALLQKEQARLFGNVAGGRVLGVPVLVALFLAVAWFEPHSWRTALLASLSVVLPVFAFLELRRYRRFGFGPTTLSRNLLVTGVLQLAMAASTGGLLSPFIYGVLPLAGLAGTFLSPRQRLGLAALQIGAIATFAVLATHAPFGGFDTPVLSDDVARLGPNHYYFHAATLSLVTLAVGQVGHALSAHFAATFGRATKAQHDLLVSHADRVRELTTLSAEIAHELKNPLASIKGLASLLVQNVDDERGNERLRVLRREVDRMQGVLEEFLNFSRPLVPLSLELCDVREIAREVVALHEGLARQRNVTLLLEGGVIESHCDPRKVKQILINLVQNALEASPSGSELALHTERGSDAVVVRVEDDGGGLDGALGDVFQPGVTSKPGGAGIGLTIARALARQHGGDLTLQSRDGRGSTAVLSLPKVAALEAEVA